MTSSHLYDDFHPVLGNPKLHGILLTGTSEMSEIANLVLVCGNMSALVIGCPIKTVQGILPPEKASVWHLPSISRSSPYGVTLAENFIRIHYFLLVPHRDKIKAL